MNMVARARWVVALSFALLGLACGDAPTANGDRVMEEALVVSLDGVAHDDAGIALRLSGAVQSVEPARPPLEIGWAADETGGTIVVVVGALAEAGDLLLVRRRVTLEPLRADVIEVSGADGEVSQPSGARALARALDE